MNPWRDRGSAVAALGCLPGPALHRARRLFDRRRGVCTACAMTFMRAQASSHAPPFCFQLERIASRTTFFVLVVTREPCTAMGGDCRDRCRQPRHGITPRPSNLLFFPRRRSLKELNRCEDAVLEPRSKQQAAFARRSDFADRSFTRPLERSDFAGSSVGRSWTDWETSQPRGPRQPPDSKVQSGRYVLLHDGIPHAERRRHHDPGHGVLAPSRKDRV